MVSVGQELGRGLAGWFCLKVIQKVAVKMSVWAAASSGLPWVWTVPHMAGKLVLVLAGGPQSVTAQPLLMAAWPSS